MYVLNSNQVASVSGAYHEGLGAFLLIGGILTIVTLGSIGGQTHRYAPPYCTMVETPFTEVIPVYDPYTGIYLGDQINTYVRTEQVCY